MVTLEDKSQIEEGEADPLLNGSNVVIGPTNPKLGLETTMGQVSDSQQEEHQAKKDMDLYKLGPSDEKQMKQTTHTKKPKTKKTNMLKTSQTPGKQNTSGSKDSIGVFGGRKER